MSERTPPFALRVTRPIVRPCVAKPGDLLIVRPGHERPVTLLRAVEPHYGAILQLVTDGALSPCDDAHDAQTRLAALAQPMARGA